MGNTDQHELGDRSLAPTHSLAHLEALELRMVDVERLVLARILVGGLRQIISSYAAYYKSALSSH